MRNIFLVLVLANLGFAAWHSWFAPEAMPAISYDGPGITLLSEIDSNLEIEIASALRPPEQPEVNASVALPAPNLNDPVTRCVSVGPFDGSLEAGVAISLLQTMGFEPTEVIVEEDIADGYWVYIEQIDSNEAAEEILAILAQDGISDAYVISNSDSGVLISLGVYSELRGAGSLGEQVRQLGFEATIAESTALAETHWLELTLTSEQSLDLDALQPEGRISPLELRFC